MSDIPLTPVTDSSAVIGHGYDSETKTLRVQFKGGNIYDLQNVPMEKYAAMTGSNSVGKFYNNRIKPLYPAIKLKPER